MLIKDLRIVLESKVLAYADSLCKHILN